MAAFKNKTIATLLAALGGTLGLHRFYLNGAKTPLPWMYPLFAWTLIPTFAGFIEAVFFSLTPDEKWDAKWNARSSEKNHSGWLVIIVAGLTLLGGMVLFMTLISFALGWYFGAGESFTSQLQTMRVV
jgi:TM2 domain-containing membrane protein YozV